MVETDQNKNMAMRDFDEEGRARSEPNDELQKI